jgi:hypothetical protein
MFNITLEWQKEVFHQVFGKWGVETGKHILGMQGHRNEEMHLGGKGTQKHICGTRGGENGETHPRDMWRHPQTF